ncbi:phosphopantothenate/pantothenate synthetase [Candidatus Micrarchaeota archaeon]|nr:phosphopantothenate/pantothenate synthetase [Candidatus Micrarchaeota archaeon]
MKLPLSHPRYSSLKQRHALVDGVKKGITAPSGLIAFGRGEAFDYLIGEKTTSEARKAEQAAAALLLLAHSPVISVNGNTAVLCPKEIVSLARETNSKIEVNLFYDSPARRKKTVQLFKQKFKTKILGEKPDKKIPALASARSHVCANGIFSANVVLVPLEDGDRTQALRRMKKKVIAIDLNPLSRTSQTANVSIVDNVVRALPNIAFFARKLKRKNKKQLVRILSSFDNKKNLKQAEKNMRRRL